MFKVLFAIMLLYAGAQSWADPCDDASLKRLVKRAQWALDQEKSQISKEDVLESMTDLLLCYGAFSNIAISDEAINQIGTSLYCKYKSYPGTATRRNVDFCN